MLVYKFYIPLWLIDFKYELKCKLKPYFLCNIKIKMKTDNGPKSYKTKHLRQVIVYSTNTQTIR